MAERGKIKNELNKKEMAGKREHRGGWEVGGGVRLLWSSSIN